MNIVHLFFQADITTYVTTLSGIYRPISAFFFCVSSSPAASQCVAPLRRSISNVGLCLSRGSSKDFLKAQGDHNPCECPHHFDHVLSKDRRMHCVRPFSYKMYCSTQLGNLERVVKSSSRRGGLGRSWIAWI